MRRLLALALVLLPLAASAADTALTGLTAASAVTSDDLLYVVDAPGGTPASRKAPISVLTTYLDTLYAPIAGAHAAVTLGTDADTLFGLSTQQVTLDVQVANTVLAGPTTGEDADPAFRALVDNDIPDTHTHTDGVVTAAQLATALDLTGKNVTMSAPTSPFPFPSGASHTTDAAGETGFDSDAWAASRGTIQVFDGTANVYLLGALVSDTPSNGQVPKWNTGGTITWEADTDTGITASSTDTLTNKTLDVGGTGNAVTLDQQLSNTILDPADADDHVWFKARHTMTLENIHCITIGGTSITLTIQECDSAGANCASLEAITCDTDGAADDGSISDTTIDAGDWVKVLYGAPSGTVESLTYSLYWSEVQ